MLCVSASYIWLSSGAACPLPQAYLARFGALSRETAVLLPGWAPAQQVFLLALEDQFAALVVDRRSHGDHPGRALRLQVDDFQHRVERIPRVDGLQEARRLLDEADQRVADDMREHAGAGRRLAQHLER